MAKYVGGMGVWKTGKAVDVFYNYGDRSWGVMMSWEIVILLLSLHACLYCFLSYIAISYSTITLDCSFIFVFSQCKSYYFL